MNRALRRHHYRRIKAKRKWYWGGPYKEPGVRYMQTEAKRLGMVATTPHPCSCIGCSNLRRMEGPPMQERRFNCSASEQIEDLAA